MVCGLWVSDGGADCVDVKPGSCVTKYLYIYVYGGAAVYISVPR